MPSKQMTKVRQRNPRGQGERLRDDIIEAASRLLADPAAPPLTLRAVAREAGVAATSVYLHFDDVRVAGPRGRGPPFRRAGSAAGPGPGRGLRSLPAGAGRGLAYCEFGLAHPGHYHVMFSSPLPLPESITPGSVAGDARRSKS